MTWACRVICHMPIDAHVLVSVAVGYGSGTSLPIFCSLGYRLQSKSCLDFLRTNLGVQGAPHAYTLVYPVWLDSERCLQDEYTLHA